LTSGGISIGKGWAGVLAIAALLCLAAVVPASALAESIAGTVTDAATHEPLAGIEVCAWAIGPEEPEGLGDPEESGGGAPGVVGPGPSCAYTGSDGIYTVSDLAAGEYEVEFWDESGEYLPQSYDGKENWWEADPVTVGSEPVTGIDAELVRAGGIAGTVTRSADGEPVEEVEVCAWEAETEEFAGCGWTDFNGEYRIQLDPGEYKVEFWPAWSGQNLAYQVYDRRDRWTEADAVAVAAEELTPGIDAELDPGAAISGFVSSAATGGFLGSIPVCSIDANTGQLWTCTGTEPNGEYTLPFLSKGQYKVVFSIDFNEWFGEEVFEEEDDGFPTEFWDNQTTLSAANVIPLTTGQAVGGIDAQLGSPSTPPAPVVTPPATVSPPPATPRKRKCRKGFKKKRVKGKVRCVKRRHRRHGHHHASRQRPAMPREHSQIAMTRFLRH
jgi:hypothetical protein